MNKIPFLLYLSTFVLLFSGCAARTVYVNKALQRPKNTSLYTKHNIWYVEPMNISSKNYQQGKILPFGSPVSSVEATEEDVKFVSEGRTFRIKFDKDWEMMPMTEYLRNLISFKSRNERKDEINPLTFEKISRGIVKKGMSKEEVLLTCGYPSKYRTPTLENDTWIYWINDTSSRRIIFRNNKVSEFIVASPE